MCRSILVFRRLMRSAWSGKHRYPAHSLHFCGVSRETVRRPADIHLFIYLIVSRETLLFGNDYEDVAGYFLRSVQIEVHPGDVATELL